MSLISGKLFSQSPLNSLIFCLLNSIIDREQHKKYLCNFPVNTYNTECLIVEVHAPLLIFKVGVLLDHGVSLRFIALLAL